MIRLRPPTPELEGDLSPDSEATLGAAYAYLQIWIGLVAVTLPFVLYFGNELLDGVTPGSISAYYYTQMHAWFIGSQFVLGVFFLSYNYRPLARFKWDNWMSSLAAVAMLVVALDPTKQSAEQSTTVGSVVHIGAAVLVFGLLGWFAYFRFTMSAPDGEISHEKHNRNLLYRACGVIIAASLVIAFVIWITIGVDQDWHPLLVFESIMIVAFAVSWLVKGGFLGILADRPRADALSPAHPGTG